MIKKFKQIFKKKYKIRNKILLLTLLSVIFLSCGKTDNNDNYCYLKYYRNGANLYMISNDSNKVEVIINYTIHAMNHDTIISNIPCRYRVSWIGKSGANKSDLIYGDEKLFKK